MSVLCKSEGQQLAENVRRIMVQQGLTIRQLVQLANLDQRTLTTILRGQKRRPHARTLHRLAQGLGVSVDELFRPAEFDPQAAFDRVSNPAVARLVAANPRWFVGWRPTDFDELYSRFGVGGELTLEGAEQAIQVMNRKRELLEKAALVLESGEADVLSGLIQLLYAKVVIHE